MNKNIEYYSNKRFDVISLVKNYEYKKILEVGGGDFSTLKHLSIEKMADGWGIDPFANLNEIRDGLRLIKGHFGIEEGQSALPEDFFDLIVAADVLEHIPNSDQFFETASLKLKKGGHLLLSVPNIRQIRAFWYIFVMGTFPQSTSGLFDDTHLRWFCRSDVEKLAIKFGFREIKHLYNGRLIPKFLNNIPICEFLALQNLFLFEKL